MNDLYATLIFGSYIFTALNWAFTFYVYRQATNHLKSRIEELERITGIIP